MPQRIEPIPTAPARLGAADLVVVAISTPLTPLIANTAPDSEDFLITAETLREDLAMRQNLPTDLIQWVQVSAAIWLNDSLACNSNSVRFDQRFEGHIYQFLIGSDIHAYHVAENMRLYCGSSADVSADVLVRVDPVAAEMVVLAQRRIAQQLDLPVRRVMLLEARPYRWIDSSLGCPQTGQVYTSVEIPGYRIVVGVGDQVFAFHTDSERLYPCEPGQEQLPAAS